MKQSKLREIQSTRASAVPDECDLFRRLLDHESAFRSFLRRRIDNDAVAEDLLQQSFVRAVQHQHSLRNDQSVVAGSTVCFATRSLIITVLTARKVGGMRRSFRK